MGTVKNRRSYYTDEKVKNLRENVARYGWAQEQQQSILAAAEKYAGKEDLLWDMVTTQELPRTSTLGCTGDPNAYICPCCKTDLRRQFGNFSGFTADPISQPWKIRCRACGHLFPSNDFGSFYRLGIDEKGNWNYGLAKANNARLVAQGEEGFLVNKLYPQEAPNWGVDDGYGFFTGGTFLKDGTLRQERKLFIALYNLMEVWFGTIMEAVTSLSQAYIYTGDLRYGRTCAILLDRIADVYPDFDIARYPFDTYYNATGWSDDGTIGGRIRDCYLSAFAIAYDAVWDVYEDPEVIRFLSQKAARYHLENPKTSPRLIRDNCENRILRKLCQDVKEKRIWGNFGAYQATLTYAAVVLDSQPETTQWLDYVFYGEGQVFRYIMDRLSRDGHNTEEAPAYNTYVPKYLSQVDEALGGYDGYPISSLMENPKFLRCMSSQMEIVACSRYAPHLGDSGYLGQPAIYNTHRLLKTYLYTKDKDLLRLAYACNGYKTEGLHLDIMEKDPERLSEDIRRAVAEETAFAARSVNLPGYGFAILRSGSCQREPQGKLLSDTQQDFYMYYGGGTTSHVHRDALTLGFHAWGQLMDGDFGTPAVKGPDPTRSQWYSATVSHNTVTVNGKRQELFCGNAQPLHFADAGKIKVMDVDASVAYPETDIYRRTLVTVAASEDVSYGVDFFRVRGGSSHTYVMSACSDEAITQGIRLTSQDGGTLAGPEIPYGCQERLEHFPTGHNWLFDVQKAAAPAEPFATDWRIKDFRGVSQLPKDLHLKLDMVNTDLSEVSFCSGRPPQTPGNPEVMKYLLASRAGDALDSLFCAVVQPYDTVPYIAAVSPAAVAVSQDGVTARAVKVTLCSGRTDYIVYSSDAEALCRVDDLFDFRGFVGVYSLSPQKEVCLRYILDGTQIGSLHTQAAVTGRVTDFQREYSTENFITVSADSSLPPQRLEKQYIYIENDGVQNAVYPISRAESVPGGFRLHLGNVTLIRKYKDPDDLTAGFLYNIQPGQAFRIPLDCIEA